MASANKDQTIEYDKKMYKKPDKPKNHLAGRVNKFQEKVNQTKAPAAPQIISIHELVFILEIIKFFLFTSSHHELEPNLLNDVKRVHQLIKDNGQQGDYAMQITFGELIPVIIRLDMLTNHFPFLFRSMELLKSIN